MTPSIIGGKVLTGQMTPHGSGDHSMRAEVALLQLSRALRGHVGKLDIFVTEYLGGGVGDVGAILTAGHLGEYLSQCAGNAGLFGYVEDDAASSSECR